MYKTLFLYLSFVTNNTVYGSLSIYLVFSINRNLEVIYSLQESVCVLYTQTTSFYTEDLSFDDFGVCGWSWIQSPEDTALPLQNLLVC